MTKVDELRINNIKEGIGMSVSPDGKSLYLVTDNKVNSYHGNHRARVFQFGP